MLGGIPGFNPPNLNRTGVELWDDSDVLAHAPIVSTVEEYK